MPMAKNHTSHRHNIYPFSRKLGTNISSQDVKIDQTLTQNPSLHSQPGRHSGPWLLDIIDSSCMSVARPQARLAAWVGGPNQAKHCEATLPSTGLAGRRIPVVQMLMDTPTTSPPANRLGPRPPYLDDVCLQPPSLQHNMHPAHPFLQYCRRGSLSAGFHHVVACQ